MWWLFYICVEMTSMFCSRVWFGFMRIYWDWWKLIDIDVWPKLTFMWWDINVEFVGLCPAGIIRGLENVVWKSLFHQKLDTLDSLIPTESSWRNYTWTFGPERQCCVSVTNLCYCVICSYIFYISRVFSCRNKRDYGRTWRWLFNGERERERENFSDVEWRVNRHSSSFTFFLCTVLLQLLARVNKIIESRIYITNLIISRVDEL